MTVRELIQILSDLDQDARVVYNGGDYGVNELPPSGIRASRIVANFYFHGMHALVEDGSDERNTTEPTVSAVEAAVKKYRVERWDELSAEVARLRRDNKRLRGWIRRLHRRTQLIGWTISCSDLDGDFAAALAGKPAPKVSR